MTGGGVISGVSVSHVHASVDEIECAGGSDAATVVEDLLSRDGVDEAFALLTCNRAEAYVVTDDAALGRAALDGFAPEVRDGAVVHLDHEESIRHLMRVAAGLESMVLGEDQILGQVKTAIEDASAVGGVGPLLENALLKAVHVGERARTETDINDGVLSVGRAAVTLLSEEIDLQDATVLVVGAGEMGVLASRALDYAGVGTVVVANRTRERAERILDDIDADGEVVSLDAVAQVSDRVDAAITATGSDEFVLDAGTFADADDIVVVDIAQPRDVDPEAASVDGVTLRDIDALESVVTETRSQREAAAAEVEAMIDDEFAQLLESFKRKRADDAISAMYESAERVKAHELQEALSKLETQGELTDEQRETVAALADALVGQILAAPTRSLRDAAAEDDWTTIQTALRLFNPEFDGKLQEIPAGAGPRSTQDGSVTDRPESAAEHPSND